MAERIEHEPAGWVRRSRAVLFLALLVVVLGALAAATLGVLVVALTTLVDHALA